MARKRRADTRRSLVFLLLASLAFPLSAFATDPPYQVTPDQVRVAARNGTLAVTVQFTITSSATGKPAYDVGKDEIVVEEDGKPVVGLEIYRPRAADPLAVVLALDVSGSMAADGKLAEAKRAALLFLDTLDAGSECGLVLFDHRVRAAEPPGRDRDRLRQQITAARPQSGTAYLDATLRAVAMLGDRPGRKAILLLTDGIDLNSKAGLALAARRAEEAGVPVYTLGVGAPGKRDPVHTVLVLDRSGSMRAPAAAGDRASKMTALHRAAVRFVDVMRPGARTSLLPFSTEVGVPAPFTADKPLLRLGIQKLEPDGETALLDAIFTAVETLAAARPPGKRAVVALTDGIDNCSRRRVEEVVARAKETGTPLHLIGLGWAGEVDAAAMSHMAQATGGQFHHARNEDELVSIFEALSIELHDDGFDQESLQALASQTGGKFMHARHAEELPAFFRSLAEELQSTYTVTFPSRRPTHDGTSRGIDIRIVRGGRPVSGVASIDYSVHGVVVPRTDPVVFLSILGVLLVLLIAPVALGSVLRLVRGKNSDLV